MALSTSSLTSGTDATNRTSGDVYTTASVTITANRLNLLAILGQIASGSISTPTIGGTLSATWVQVGQVAFEGTTGRIYLYRSMESSGGSGTITINPATSQTWLRALWSVSDFSNVETTGTSGSDAVTQVAAAQLGGANTEIVHTWPIDLQSGGFMVTGLGSGDTSISPDPAIHWGERHDVNVESKVLETQFAVNPSAAETVKSSWSTSSANAAAIMLEVVELNTEKVYATSHITGGASTPANANGETDGTFTTDTGDTDWTSRWAMGQPAEDVTADAQKVSIRCKKSEASSADPTIAIDLWEAGSSVKSLLSATSVSSTTAIDVDGTSTFSSADITDDTGADVEIQLAVVGGQNTETLEASSHITGSCSTPANAVGVADATWTTDSGDVDWDSRWAMDNPSGTPTGTQTINILCRKAGTGGGDPTLTCEVWENGTFDSTIFTSQSVTNDSGGQTLSGTFAASGISNFNDVEVRLVATANSGNPSLRRTVQIDEIQWSAPTTAGASIQVDSILWKAVHAAPAAGQNVPEKLDSYRRRRIG